MAAKGKYKAWRPDKVVMREPKGNHKGKHWKVTKAEIVGDANIAEAGKGLDGILTPSDHFGVVVDCVYTEN